MWYRGDVPLGGDGASSGKSKLRKSSSTSALSSSRSAARGGHGYSSARGMERSPTGMPSSGAPRSTSSASSCSLPKLPGRPGTGGTSTSSGSKGVRDLNPRSRFAKLGLSAVASTDPGPSSLAASDGDEEEIIRLDKWSVVRVRSSNALLYIDTSNGKRYSQAPPEVLYALNLDEDGSDGGDGSGAPPADAGAMGRTGMSMNSTTASTDGNGGTELMTPSDDQDEDLVQELSTASFRRIVLGTTAKSRDMPVRMARDLCMALREDVSMFEQLQQRFSDYPSEPAMFLCDDFSQRRLPDGVENLVLGLKVGEASDVVATENDGIQILLRMS
eukprot:TRINITY_DN8004_c0_g1_i1.p1 TRINITY_DN8004_c0_g1~~TRINITY_DN8004_c0_g1_i1.p1  ORF type:complete len:330 (+),score=73.78 TRINITY_DN8004_c0_g1_i1:38-1027(+)